MQIIHTSKDYYTPHGWNLRVSVLQDVETMAVTYEVRGWRVNPNGSTYGRTVVKPTRTEAMRIVRYYFHDHGRKA